MENVKAIIETIESEVVGVKGKRQAQAIAEMYLDEEGLLYSKGRRPSFTVYYIGGLSMFISYNASGRVTEIKTM